MESPEGRYGLKRDWAVVKVGVSGDQVKPQQSPVGLMTNTYHHMGKAGHGLDIHRDRRVNQFVWKLHACCEARQRAATMLGPADSLLSRNPPLPSIVLSCILKAVFILK